MKVGDLVQCKTQSAYVTGEQTGVITRLRRNSMNSSDKHTTYYVYWFHIGRAVVESHSSLEVINESR